MSISVEQALELAVNSGGYLYAMNSVENFLFANDDESKTKVRELKNKTGPLDRREAIKEVSLIITEAVEQGRARKENTIQAILMIANESQKRKNKKRR